MTRTTKKRKAISDPPESSQQPQTDATGPRKVKIPKITAASLTMREEKHAWLKWTGCSNERKIELNNRLAELQNRTICPPRFLEGEVVDKLAIKHQLDKLFLTRVEDEDGELEIPIWRKGLNVAEEIYREWCLEFYCSLRVDKKFRGHEFYSKKLIHFRLGGKEHSKTLAEFGYLTGLFTEAESKHDMISTYLLAGKRSVKEFGSEADAAWLELTGLKKHTSISKVSAIRSPILRLIHKLLVYSFTHRLTQHDKCYLDDLWLIYTFSKKEPGNFICAPWVLANFMETKGAGKKKDSQICCGHFVTRIVRNLGLFTTPNIKACSLPVDFKRVTLHDLEVMRLLNPGHTGLIEEAAEEDAPAAPIRKRKKRETMMDVLEQIQKQNREIKRMHGATQRMVNCQSQRLEYYVDRYRPVLEKFATAHAAEAGTSLAPHHPPSPFAPISADEDTDEQEVEEEESGNEASSEEAPEDEEAEEED